MQDPVEHAAAPLSAALAARLSQQIFVRNPAPAFAFTPREPASDLG